MSSPRILLVGAYKPYGSGEDISHVPQYMELFHNQLTRFQGASSFRQFHHTNGLWFIAANLDAPVVVLEFPTWDEFVQEVQDGQYDIVGIGAIYPNLKKAKKMCQAIRRWSPRSTIVIGGHLANLPDLKSYLDADHVVPGEGVAWFRNRLNQDPDAPMRHPAMTSNFGRRWMGFPLSDTGTNLLIPSVGCPMGCKFCATSAMFGGRGKSILFYRTAEELFSVMCQLERISRNKNFFIMDENLLGRRRLMRDFLKLVREHGRDWSLYSFSSARDVRAFGLDDVVRLGLGHVWIGMENEDAGYDKLRGIDTRGLIREMREHGIIVTGSTIIGEEHHTVDSARRLVDRAVSHDCDFHQFTLLTAFPGTPLYREYGERGLLLGADQCPPEDVHALYRFNYRHPHIPPGAEDQLIVDAFKRDLEANGPSAARMIRTMLNKWKKYRRDPEDRLRRAVRRECGWLPSFGAAAVRVLSKERPNDPKIAALLRDLKDEFGLTARLAAPGLGGVMRISSAIENLKLAAGWNYEPRTCRWVNDAASATVRKTPAVKTGEIRWVTAKPLEEVL